MDPAAFPTKRNLRLAKRNLDLAKQGYDMLDKKCQVLTHELNIKTKETNALTLELNPAFDSAYKALAIACMKMGIYNVENICCTIDPAQIADIRFVRIMGIALPQTEIPMTSTLSPPYNIVHTTKSLDEARICWQKVRDILIVLAGIQNTVYRLKIHTAKTRKRVSTLENIIIPKCQTHIRYIKERLEERERDEFSRLKLIRDKQ